MRRFLIACPLLLLATGVLWGAEDTKKAAETRKALKTKVTFKWKDTSFGDVLEEIKTGVKGIRIHRDEKAINLNKQITYSCKDKPLEDVFAELLGKSGWGYYVNSKKDAAYDGDVYIRVGEERGYPKGEEPKEKPKEEKPKEKPKVEEKPKEEKPKEKPSEEDAEKDAARKLKLAKQLLEDGQVEGAKDSLEAIVKKYKDTKAAEEAKQILKKLDK